MKIAVIPPLGKSDYLANTVLDGLLWLKHDGEDLQFILPSYEYPCPYELSEYKKSEADFMQFASQSDMIILCWGKGATNYDLARKINRWSSTVFVDGSELGKDRRYDLDLRKQVEDMIYEGNGAIDRDMLARCALYFRREKPYIHSIVPFPFGIESRYVKYFNSDIKKDIDFTCIFGQEDFPKMRREAREYLEKFCKQNGFTCATKKTKGFSFDDNAKLAGRDQFYETLVRSKVGVSIGGGGYDTARFWEILGNNCMLLTETVDIFEQGSDALNYERIWQFGNMEEFKNQVQKLAEYLKAKYDQNLLYQEYDKILREHTSRSRVKMLLDLYNKKRPDHTD